MNRLIILKGNIPIVDLGNIDIVTSEDSRQNIRRKIDNLYIAMQAQIELFRAWYRQGDVLSQEQAKQLLQVKPTITAYYIKNKLYQINDSVDSMDELSEEFSRYEKSIIDAVYSSKESIIVDDVIFFFSWIQTKLIHSTDGD